jgi:lysophospholipase L1-like esterase
VAVLGSLANPVKPSGIARVAAMVRRLAASIIGIAAALAVTEYGTRFVFERAAAKTDVAPKGDPQVSINSLGFREREIGRKDPARYRIAIIGDSYTWGQALEVEERFSNVLGEFLGPRYEVLNFGIPGHKVADDLAELEPVLRLSPDFVLLQMYINNFETPSMERPHTYPLLPADVDRRFLQTWSVYRLLSDRWAQLQEAIGLVDSYESYMARHLRDPDSPDSRESFGKLRQFFDRTHAAGVGSGAVLFPAADAMGPFGTNYPFGYLHNHVKAVCADERVPCLDLLPLFSALPDPQSTWISPLDAHPNAPTNRRAAIQILREFESVWRH